MRDVKLCELELRRNERQLGGKDGRVSGKWRGPFWVSCTFRQYALLPIVGASLPLVLLSGTPGNPDNTASAPSICIHAITLCFALLALDHVGLESALPMSNRIAAEEEFARSRATNAINTYTGVSNTWASASAGQHLLAVSKEEKDRLTTNEMVTVATILAQFAAVLLPVFAGGSETGHATSPQAIDLAIGAPFLGTLLCGVLEGAALADRKLSTSSRLWTIAIEVAKWTAGLLVYILFDVVLLL